eukprot:gb/GECH01007868.1/.p1 GENE.gb/GECH01007868.1/~~gb/GECH01007868.1/.p1  ORF type:complete len:361 (+),score=53.33 gb/GECH01007868.1/:1-1083(+)
MPAQLLSHSKHEFSRAKALGYGNGHYIKHRNIFVYYGGQKSNGIQNKVFYIDLSSFKIVEPDVATTDRPPGSRGSHSFLLHDRYIWLVSGFDYNWNAIGTQSFFRLDVDTWTWKKYHSEGVNPPGRAGATLTPVKLPDQKQVYIMIGGNLGFERRIDVVGFVIEESSSNDDQINFNIRWLPIEPQSHTEYPQKRSSHTAIPYRYDHNHDDGQILMFGGWAGQVAFDDLWMLEISSHRTYRWHSIQIPSAPPPPVGLPVKSSGHTMVNVGNYAIISGGFSNQIFQHSFYALNLATLTWEHIDNPIFPHPILAGHVVDRCNESKVLVYGGNNGMEWQSTLHILTFKSKFGEDVEAMLDQSIG